MGRIGWLGLGIVMMLSSLFYPTKEKREKCYGAFYDRGRGVYVEVFPFGIFWGKCCPLVYCHSDLGLKSFCWV